MSHLTNTPFGFDDPALITYKRKNMNPVQDDRKWRYELYKQFPETKFDNPNINYEQHQENPNTPF